MKGKTMLLCDMRPKFKLFQKVQVTINNQLEDCEVYGMQIDERRKTFLYMLKCCKTSIFNAFENEIVEYNE